ncbi:hypothetical protein [Streptomyces sp. RerS4]|uniref:hypothetical protein n=1 Tax=Streptomyces sp. RerS4 TaxID=2942449 RepID=UPI00201BA92B|nr:hypothetical protein [Streptomyces sp. RerS4]UQX04304.1 hypothetical protein M4D82_30200 [Streptomyces sp. RerS4]
MNPQFGNGADTFFDDFGPRHDTPAILIHGHPFNRSTQVPGATVPAAAGDETQRSDLRRCGEIGADRTKSRPFVFPDDALARPAYVGRETTRLAGAPRGDPVVPRRP